MDALPVACACGAVRGHLEGPWFRMTCHCDDCQRAARWLGRDDLLDRHGGSDIVLAAPAHFHVDAGQAKLGAMRLTPRGLVRWYTTCCRTPAGNLIDRPRVPVFGLHRRMIAATDAALAAVAPSGGGIHGRFATLDAEGRGPGPEVHARASVSTLIRSAAFVARSALRGWHAPSPFRDAAGALRVAPHGP